jgi:uncharacterized metal-binding protein
MENAETILVIVLASFLALFLLLAIIVAVKAIQLLNRLKHISEKAESIADKAETAANFISKAAGPAMIGNLLANIADAVSSKKSKKKR